MSTHPYIQSLDVKDLGLFDNLHVAFTPGLNIIIGPNASGKTSLLRVITYCFNGQALSKYRFKQSTSFGVTVNEGDGVCFTAGWDGLDHDNEMYHGHDVVVSGNNFPDPSYPPVPGRIPYNLLAIGAHRFFDYSEVKFIKKEEERSKAKADYDTLNPEYIDKPGLPSIKQWMVNRYFQIDKDWAEIERKNWDTIVNNLSLLAPDENQFSLKEIGRDLEPKFELDGQVCYLEELSSGFKSILSIVFSIVQWIELVNEGDHRLIEKAEGTVLIDEIDSHLHPSWQAKIMPVLGRIFPTLQFIVTTHSPLVMSTIKNTATDSIQQLTHIPAEGFRCQKIRTYGNDATSIISGILGAVPRDIDSDNAFSELYRLIDDEAYAEAVNKLADLKAVYGDLPELLKAESMLTFLLPE